MEPTGSPTGVASVTGVVEGNEVVRLARKACSSRPEGVSEQKSRVYQETALKSNVFSMPKALSPEPSLFSSHATSPIRKRFAGPSSRPERYSPSRSPSPTGDVKRVAGPSAPPARYAPSRSPSPPGGIDNESELPLEADYDEDGGDDSDNGSDYIDTRAKERRDALEHNRFCKPGERLALDDEELEEYDLEELEQDQRKQQQPKRQRNRPTASSRRPGPRDVDDDGGVDDSGDERPDSDDEEEEEWSVKPGPPPKAAVEEAARGLKTFLGDLRVIAKANHSAWGAYQFWSRVHTPKTEDMTNEQWAEMVRANYHALTENLPEDERKDPEALQRVMQPYLDFMEQATIGSNDERKSGRGGVALMEKALRPMIQQSSMMSELRELEVMGICVDFTVTNNRAIAWGGSDLYDEMKRRYPVPLEKLSAQWVDLLEKTRGDMKQEASGLQPRPNPVHVSLRPAPGKRTRDFIHSQFTSLALNTAYLTLMERDDLSAEEARAKLGQMPWGTFADAAVSHNLCWLGWPNALKARGRHPGPGFSFTSFKNKATTSDEKGNEESETAALREACALMLRAYEGEDVPDAPYVGSWSQADIELEDPIAVPIVICQDGTVLLRAGDSKKLLNRLARATTYKSGTKNQPASKNKSGSEKNAPSARKRPRPPADDKDRTTRVRTMMSHPKSVGAGQVAMTEMASGYSLVSPDDMSAAENHIEVEMRPGTWIQLDSARLAFSQFQAAIMNGAYADIAHDDD
ncbi:hypothetical protein C8F01DRAFT_1322572 [Mycena amicta]|nr:hypothetical protein C8F01DRAFT_1375304 [Mycena amicta]KAJ7054961.1 hypothetical protein C8F01DRAFT_1322572 [Mycena amicta]